MQQNQPLPSTTPVLWILAGILMAGAFDSALHLIMNLAQTLLILSKTNLAVLRAGAVLGALVTLGVELLVVIWMIKNRGRIQTLSTNWIIGAMVVWPLCYMGGFFLNNLQPRLLMHLIEIREFTRLQQLKIALSFIQSGVYIIIVIGAVGYLLLQKHRRSF